jgi:hypothetical protein
MYQMPDKGLAADITAKSTKYYKDDDLSLRRCRSIDPVGSLTNTCPSDE